VRPKRHDSETDLQEFEDPLKKYNKPASGDALERALEEDPVTAIAHKPFKSVPPETTVEAAMKLMVELDIACLLVTQGDRLVGVFSERDVLTKVTPDFEQMKREPIRRVMIGAPVVVHVTDSAAKALNLMATGSFRHVPILDVDDHVVGVIGPRRVTAYLQKYLEAE